MVGKELSRSKKLADYIGKNEKTTIVAKLQKRGGGAPVREAAIDEQTQKEMMAFAYKKQQEWKVGCCPTATVFPYLTVLINVCVQNVTIDQVVLRNRVSLLALS